MKTVTIQPNRTSTYFVLAVWCFLGLASIGIASFGFGAAAKAKYGAACVMWIGSFFLLMTAIFSARSAWRSIALEGPLLELTSSTLYDKRISTSPVPWSGIEWRAVHAKSGSIQIAVAPEFEGRMFKSIGDRFSASFCKLTGFPPYTVSPWGTGHSTRDLEALFATFKPPMAK